MARHKSAVKRTRQNETKYGRNVSYKSKIKTVTKNTLAAVKSPDKAAALESLKRAIPIIDKASTKGILHKKTSGRKISRLQRLVNSLESA